MNVTGVRIGRLPERDHVALLHRARAASPTYDHVGSTLDPLRCDVAVVRAQSVDVGRGTDAFDRARAALQTWVAQRGIGADVVPGDAAVVTGGTVVVVLRRGPFTVVAPNRIVEVVDESRRFAFAYGTLPGHPERGEESFEVEHLPDGAVRVTIRVQACGATFATRAGAPLVRRLQTAAVRAYLQAIANHVANHVVM